MNLQLPNFDKSSLSTYTRPLRFANRSNGLVAVPKANQVANRCGLDIPMTLYSCTEEKCVPAFPSHCPKSSLKAHQLMLPLIINLVCGAVGGNVAGALIKKINMGTLWNSVAGILGGGLGGQILSLLGISAGGDGSLDVTSIIENVAAGGVGGGSVLAIVGVIKSMLSSSK